MSKAPKDLRIPIMMSAAEVSAIDDWRYANRIATRAEAVRRLCQVGLFIDSGTRSLSGLISDLYKAESIKENIGKVIEGRLTVALYLLKEAVSEDGKVILATDVQSLADSLMTEEGNAQFLKDWKVFIDELVADGTVRPTIKTLER